MLGRGILVYVIGARPGGGYFDLASVNRWPAERYTYVSWSNMRGCVTRQSCYVGTHPILAEDVAT